jgi:hypothetical protein
MADLSNFITLPQEPETVKKVQSEELPEETTVLIKRGCSFSEVVIMATQNRKTHPNEPVEWFPDGNGTYTLNRVVIINGNNH